MAAMSIYTPPPPLEKKRHHFVPQFWLKRFRDANQTLWMWDGNKVKPASAGNIMQLEWLNTVFDDQWHPSDWLENQLSRLEAIVAQVYRELDHAQGADLQQLLPWLPQVLALQACRHPHVLLSGHRKAGRLAELIADASLHDTEADFVKAAQQLGVPEADAQEMYLIASAENPDEAAAAAAFIQSLSPQDPRLPMTDALRALDPIATKLGKLSYEVLDVPSGSTFVLGDTPLAQSQLGAGFVVPLSKTMAVRAHPAGAPAIGRRVASAAEVQSSNNAQWEMALDIVVGPDTGVLQALGPK
jgi:uncharacterized protein DUF4238